jgi:hypothetical protein
MSSAAPSRPPGWCITSKRMPPAVRRRRFVPTTLGGRTSWPDAPFAAERRSRAASDRGCVRIAQQHRVPDARAIQTTRRHQGCPTQDIRVRRKR